MNDLISRNTLIEEIENIEVKIDYDALNKLVEASKDEDVLETIIKYVMWQTSEIAMQHIELQPTIEAVPVVRCKDCDLLQDCKIGQYLGLDGYCSNAEMGCE